MTPYTSPAYLRGIETFLFPPVALQKLTSPAYLRGIETPVEESAGVHKSGSPAYLRGIETPASASQQAGRVVSSLPKRN